MKEGLIKNAYEAIIKEIQTTLTIAYIVTVGIGMLFHYQYYSEFGINIFDYADVFEFLIAPFSDFKILFFSMASITLSLLIIQMDILWKRKYPKNYSKMNFRWDKKPWFTTFRIIAFSVLFITYLYIAADMYGEYASSKTRESASVTLKFIDNETVKGIMVGKTTDIIFLLRDEQITAIPYGALVKEFEVK